MKDNLPDSQIVLTFDDGPHHYFSNAIVDALEEFGCPAAFFVLGSKAKSNTTTLRRMAQGGHEIGVHGWTHQKWSSLTQADVLEEISRAKNVVENATGRGVRFYRPPYGVLPAHIARACDRLGLIAIGWHVSSYDWSGLSTDEVIVEVAHTPLRDKILLFHDGCGNPTAIVDFVRWLLPVCRQGGIHPTSLEAYLAQCRITGKEYAFEVPTTRPGFPMRTG